MKTLFAQVLKHISRTRLFYLALLLTFLIEMGGLKMVSAATLYMGDEKPFTIGPEKALFVAVFLQLFTGAFLSAVFGIWIMPYLHQGQRGQLTFVLPISKWFYPVVYAAVLAIVLLAQYCVTLGAYAFVFGWDPLRDITNITTHFAGALVLQLLAFEVLAFSFSIGSICLGAIPTFFLGAMVIFILQVGGIVFHVDPTRVGLERPPFFSSIEPIYRMLPPVGELIFQLKSIFSHSEMARNPFLMWIIWFTLLIFVFRILLRYPIRLRGDS